MSSPTAVPRLDTDAVNEFAFRVWGYKQGEMVALMIHLGDRLGIYDALRGAGMVSAAELAAKTGLQERWLLEWLRGQAAAGLLDHQGGERFELTDIGAAVLADEETSLAFAAGAFAGPTSPEVVDALAEAFRTGIGLSYEQLGAAAAHRTERMLGPWARLALVPRIIPALEGVGEKLRSGARVLDVGCGGGVAVMSLARSFPESRFVGIDPSAHAIELAAEKARRAGLQNTEFVVRRGEEIEDESAYDLVITFDCLHDMTRPDRVMAAIRGAIKEDGTWLIKEIKGHADFDKNLRNPMLAMMYGFSVSACMSSALSEPDGMGLGTLGLHTEKAREMTAAAGFSRFRIHDFDDPANLYYEVRP